MAGDFLAKDFMAHAVTFRDFMTGIFLGGYRIKPNDFRIICLSSIIIMKRSRCVETFVMTIFVFHQYYQVYIHVVF